MNNSKPSSKVGLIDIELNDITKILFVATLAMSVIMVALKGWDGPWYFYVFRFVLLFSYLIPISLRVNLDMGKIYYSLQIQRDRLVVEIIYERSLLGSIKLRAAMYGEDHRYVLTTAYITASLLAHCRASAKLTHLLAELSLNGD